MKTGSGGTHKRSSINCISSGLYAICVSREVASPKLPNISFSDCRLLMNVLPVEFCTQDFDAFREWEVGQGIEADRRQLSRGRAMFEATFAAFGPILVLRYRESHRWLTEYSLPAGYTEVTFGRYPEPPVWCAVELPASFAAIQLGGRDYRAVMPGGEIYCILIPNPIVDNWGLIPEEVLSRAETPEHAAAPLSRELWRQAAPKVDACLKSRGNALSDTIAQDVLLSVCNEMIDVCFSDHVGQAAIPKAGLVDSARDLMSDRLVTSMTIGDVAHDLGVSRRVLERAFSKHLAMTPYQYLIMERLHQARSILKNRQHTALETLLACGFQDASRFAGMYARHFGELPSETLGRRQHSA